jgi:bifunctional non-homologous end joining protein LigD
MQLNGHLTGDGAVKFSHACRLDLEGIVTKHQDHPYRSGPSKSWLGRGIQTARRCGAQ